MKTIAEGHRIPEQMASATSRCFGRNVYSLGNLDYNKGMY
jgi:hypothetical protein